MSELPKKWAELVKSSVLQECVNQIPKDCVPRRELVFKAFEYFNPEDCEVVILGQDPYPSINDAQGLSFSTTKKRQSISRIFKCLIDMKMLASMPETGDLHCWAERGVLLMNSMLTLGGKFWSELTGQLLVNLLMVNQKAVVFAWGEDAKKLVANLPESRVIKFTHPASRTPIWNFAGFSQVSDTFLLNGGWSMLKYIRIYTDGACTKNGKKNARGGWACVFHAGLTEKPFLQMTGRLLEKEFLMVDGSIKTKNESQKPATNNRGEMFAIIVGLLKVYKLHGACSVEIITDSDFCINVATKWMHNWYPNFGEKKNPDLVGILYEVYKLHKVRFTHQPAHVENPKTPNEIGNTLADALASSSAKRDDFKTLAF